MVRWYMLTNKEPKKGRNVLHTAAINGDKDFCSFIIHEAHLMGHLDEMINEEDNDEMTPFYLLCEKGYLRFEEDGEEA